MLVHKWGVSSECEYVVFCQFYQVLMIVLFAIFGRTGLKNTWIYYTLFRDDQNFIRAKIKKYMKKLIIDTRSFTFQFLQYNLSSCQNSPKGNQPEPNLNPDHKSNESILKDACLTSSHQVAVQQPRKFSQQRESQMKQSQRRMSKLKTIKIYKLHKKEESSEYSGLELTRKLLHTSLKTSDANRYGGLILISVSVLVAVKAFIPHVILYQRGED